MFVQKTKANCHIALYILINIASSVFFHNSIKITSNQLKCYRKTAVNKDSLFLCITMQSLNI